MDLSLETYPRILAEAANDSTFLNELYAALCNTVWIRRDNRTKEEFVEVLQGENKFFVSWRVAGCICADIYNRVYVAGEVKSYIDYYCGGNEGEVSPRVEQVMYELGWDIISRS
jgi:hypothetical protein